MGDIGNKVLAHGFYAFAFSDISDEHDFLIDTKFSDLNLQTDISEIKLQRLAEVAAAEIADKLRGADKMSYVLTIIIFTQVQHTRCCAVECRNVAGAVEYNDTIFQCFNPLIIALQHFRLIQQAIFKCLFSSDDAVGRVTYQSAVLWGRALAITPFKNSGRVADTDDL